MCVSGSLVHNYFVGGDTRAAAAAEYRAGRVLCNAIPVHDAHDGIGMEISDGARAVCRVIRAVGNVLVSGPSGERNVRASCACTRFPDADHPCSGEGLTLLQYFFFDSSSSKRGAYKNLYYSSTRYLEARARWRIKMSHFRPPVAREFHSALFPRLFFRVGGNSTQITDQNFRTISNFISPSNMHVPFPTLFRISEMLSISMSLVLQHALGNPTFRCLGCLMCPSSEDKSLCFVCFIVQVLLIRLVAVWERTTSDVHPSSD